MYLLLEPIKDFVCLSVYLQCYSKKGKCYLFIFKLSKVSTISNGKLW